MALAFAPDGTLYGANDFALYRIDFSIAMRPRQSISSVENHCPTRCFETSVGNRA